MSKGNAKLHSINLRVFPAYHQFPLVNRILDKSPTVFLGGIRGFLGLFYGQLIRAQGYAPLAR